MWVQRRLGSWHLALKSWGHSLQTCGTNQHGAGKPQSSQVCSVHADLFPYAFASSAHQSSAEHSSFAKEEQTPTFTSKIGLRLCTKKMRKSKLDSQTNKSKRLKWNQFLPEFGPNKKFQRLVKGCFWAIYCCFSLVSCKGRYLSFLQTLF